MIGKLAASTDPSVTLKLGGASLIGSPLYKGGQWPIVSLSECPTVVELTLAVEMGSIKTSESSAAKAGHDGVSRAFTPASATANTAALKCPPSLQMLTLEAVLSHLLALCQKRHYTENKRALKHYLKFQLPAVLRQQLIDLALKDQRIHTMIDLNIFELLLSPTVKRINVQNVRPFFRESVAEMLQHLGTGVETLILEDNSWLQSKDVLPLALSRMPYLQIVSLRYLANDAILASLGRHCIQLLELDVSGSADVTDQGLQVLCRPWIVLDLEKDSSFRRCCCHPFGEQQVKKRSRKISAPAQTCVTHWIPRLVKGIRRHSVHHKKNVEDYVPTYPTLDEESAVLWPEDEEALRQLESDRRSTGSAPNCIRHLRLLALSGTQVTADGIQLVLDWAPEVSILS